MRQFDDIFFNCIQTKFYHPQSRSGNNFHYGHYNPSVSIDLVSYITYVVCVNSIHKWWNLHFKVDSKRQIFCETFHGNFIYSQSISQKSAERISPKKYFSYFDRIVYWLRSSIYSHRRGEAGL